MGKVLEDIIKSLERLNGAGTLAQIFEEYSKINPNPVFSSVRREIQQGSSDTKSQPKKKDLFFPIDNLGSGKWGLRSYFEQNIIDPTLEENNSKSVDRKNATISRIIRITAIAIETKKLAGNQCQLCGLVTKLNNGNYYSEAHHIKPLGRNHNGPDVKDNLLIVCPNCHIKCDYGLIKLSLQDIQNNVQDIDKQYIDYHNKEIFGRIKL